MGGELNQHTVWCTILLHWSLPELQLFWISPLNVFADLVLFAFNLFSSVALDVGCQKVLAQLSFSGLYFFLLTAQSYSVASIMTIIHSAPLCSLGSWAKYLLKVFLLHFLPKAISSGQYNYYVAELAFYWSLMFSQFIDIKRKVSQQQLCWHYHSASQSHPFYQNCYSYSLLYLYQGSVFAGLTFTPFHVTNI